LFSSEICTPPEVAYGYVTGEATDNGRVYFGTVNCHAGYELVGKQLIKCMNGIWSAEYPVCTRE
jgi:hypothetical protein